MISIGTRIKIVETIEQLSKDSCIYFDNHLIGGVQHISMVWNAQKTANIKDCCIYLVKKETNKDLYLDFAKEMALHGFWVEVVDIPNDIIHEYYVSKISNGNTTETLLIKEDKCSTHFTQQKLAKI